MGRNFLTYWCRWFVLVAAPGLAGVPLVSAADVTAERLDGTALTGQLLSIEPGRVSLSSGGAARTIGFPELLQLVWQAPVSSVPAPASAWVRLTDGSQLQIAQYRDSAGTAMVKLLNGDQLEMPTRSVHSVRLHPPSDLRDPQWNKIVSRDAKLDVLVVRRPGSSLDYVEGALGGVTEAAVRFTLDGEAMDVPLERLEGWTYYAPQNEPLSTPVCRIKDTIGNLWNAAQVELSNDAVQIQTVAGVRHKLSADQLVVIDFASGNVIFLSDLQPLKLQWTPLLTSPAVSDSLARLFQPRRDRSLGGGKLRLRSAQDVQRTQEFDKGLAIHSRSELVYRLPDGFRV